MYKNVVICKIKVKFLKWKEVSKNIPTQERRV